MSAVSRLGRDGASASTTSRRSPWTFRRGLYPEIYGSPIDSKIALMFACLYSTAPLERLSSFARSRRL